MCLTCPRPQSQFRTQPRREPYVVGNEGPMQPTSLALMQKEEPLLRAFPGSDPEVEPCQQFALRLEVR